MVMKKTYTHRINVRFTDEEAVEIEKEAEKKGQKIAVFLRNLVIKSLKRGNE